MSHTNQFIIPAIIPRSLDDLVFHIDALPQSISEIQIDLVDGLFVPFVSWPYATGDFSVSPILKSLTQRYVVEVDVMVVDVEERVRWCIDHGVQKIVVHLESEDNVLSCITPYANEDCTFGLSVNNSTPIELVPTAIASVVSYMQCMGIASIGSQGQPFDVSVCDRIRALQQRFPGMPVSVDGAMNADTIPQVKDAGASRFVVGSALFAGVRNTHNVFDRVRMIEDAYTQLDKIARSV